MSFWDELRAWVRALIRIDPLDSLRPAPPEPLRPVPPDHSQVLRPRVLLITFNPVVQSEGGQRLVEVLGWNNADQLCRECIIDLRECSNGFLNYHIVDRLEVDAWPVKIDGFRYDEKTFLDCWRSGRGWHQPDTVDYEAIIDDFDLISQINADEIDEVWLFGFPYAGFYESQMVGPGAFWCNSPPITRNDVARRFVIMGFNYERDVGEMLESFGHRFESHLKRAWRHVRGDDNLWEQFILYDKKAPGKANVGWMHYAPNSLTDYDWGNQTLVRSNCDDWLKFPNFQGTTRLVNCSDWGNGDIRAHHKWWFKHLPNAPGHTWGISNNWWWYGVDPNSIK